MANTTTLLLCLSMWTLFLSNLFLFKHPLLLTINVLMLASATSLSLNSMSIWYAYMLFMVFAGGLLVIFIYIASLAPNAIFTLNSQIIPLTTQAVMTITLFLLKPPVHTNPAPSLPQNTKETTASLVHLFLDQNVKLLIFAAMALIMSMTIVMNLFKPSDGPMRPFKTSITNLSNNTIYEKISHYD
uniref:NADH dehydrogenase subunit 6 n=1 Tax=Cumberlandia monodonta TaxID=52365 RepID=A0A1X9JPB0_CUMMO|nr:NADH dehydrogenase subunit 6 [Cumberlandia monodonta]